MANTRVGLRGSDRLRPRDRKRLRTALRPNAEGLETRALLSGGVTRQSLFEMAAQVAHIRQALNVGRFQRPIEPTFRIQSVVINPRAGRVVARFQGAEGGGVDPASLDGAVSLVRRQSPRLPFATTLFGAPVVLPNEFQPVNAGGPTPEPTVAAVFDFGRPIPLGNYRLRIDSGGVRDLAGGALDGEFRGAFPTGDGAPGGDFLGRTATNGFRAYPFRPAFGPRA